MNSKQNLPLSSTDEKEFIFQRVISTVNEVTHFLSALPKCKRTKYNSSKGIAFQNTSYEKRLSSHSFPLSRINLNNALHK